MVYRMIGKRVAGKIKVEETIGNLQSGESPIRDPQSTIRNLGNPQSAIRNPHLRHSAFGRYWNFIRPFTLLVPAMGMVAGSLVALGAPPRLKSDWVSGTAPVALQIVLGGLMAAVLNAASNALNQIFDLEIDRINKPDRMLPSGRMTVRQAWVICAAAFIAALLLAARINWQCLSLAVAAVVLTFAYSAPPLRTKGRG